MSELNIPESWAETTIGEVFEVLSGSTPKTSKPENYTSDGIKWITPADLSKLSSVFIGEGRRDITKLGYESCSTRLLPKNSVIYTTRAPIGHIAIASNELCTNQGFKSLVIRELWLSKFIYYYLKHITPYIQSKGSGITFKEVSSTVMKSIPVILPPRGEQERIVKKIESCFEKIDEVIYSFDSINNKFEKLSLSFLVNEGGWLPAIFLEEITTERNERVGIKNPSHRKIGVDNKIGVVDLRVTSKNTFEKYKIVKKGDILYNPMRVNVGSIALYLDEDEAITSPDYIVFSTNEGYSSWLIYNYLKSSFGAEEISRKLTGSVRERLYYKKLKNIPFPNPSLEIHGKANRVLNGLNLEIRLFQEKMEKLLSLTKSSILEKAFQGQLVPQIANEGTGLELLELINNNRKKKKK